MTLWTAVLTCADCGTELNRARHVPDKYRGQVVLSSPLVAGPCPKGCRATCSDINMNTDLRWEPEAGGSQCQ